MHALANWLANERVPDQSAHDLAFAGLEVVISLTCCQLTKVFFLKGSARLSTPHKLKFNTSLGANYCLSFVFLLAFDFLNQISFLGAFIVVLMETVIIVGWCRAA